LSEQRSNNVCWLLIESTRAENRYFLLATRCDQPPPSAMNSPLLPRPIDLASAAVAAGKGACFLLTVTAAGRTIHQPLRQSRLSSWRPRITAHRLYSSSPSGGGMPMATRSGGRMPPAATPVIGAATVESRDLAAVAMNDDGACTALPLRLQIPTPLPLLPPRCRRRRCGSCRRCR
ncbi:unnamed protein product, partial [Phaeothamnion confervicola]